MIYAANVPRSLYALLILGAVLLPAGYGQPCDDFNGDGVVDFHDLASVKELSDLIDLQACLDIPRGDATGAGEVAFPSFLILANNFGNQAASVFAADFNLDGGVNIEDLAILSHNFGVIGFAPDPPPIEPAHLSTSLTHDRFITVSSERSVDVGGMQLGSAQGNLIPIAPGNGTLDASPFTFLLSNQKHSVVWGDLASSVRLEGDLVTGVQYRAGAAHESDLYLRWFERGSYEVFSSGPVVDQPFAPASQPQEPTPPIPPGPSRPDIVDCNGVSVSFSDLVLATDESKLIEMHACLNIPRGDLDGNGKVAFADFVLSSSAFGTAATGYRSGDVNIDGMVDLKDYSIIAQNFGKSGYQPELGPITPAKLSASLNPQNKIVVSTSSPTELGGLEFTSLGGNFVPIVDGVKVAPFDFTLFNSEQQISFAGLATSVTLDGDLVTQVELQGEPLAGDLRMRWFELGSYEVFSIEDPLGDQTGVTPPLDPPTGLPIPGDFDGNGIVEFEDFLVVSQNFGLLVNGIAQGDIDGNGLVAFKDFLVLSFNFGRTSAQASSLQPVPEVDVTGPLGVGCCCYWWLGRRRFRRNTKGTA